MKLRGFRNSHQGWWRRPATGAAGGGASVPYVAVPVPDHPQEVETEGQQGRAQQVPQSRQVGDGEAVGVFAAPPHGVDHPVGYAQEQQDLRRTQAVRAGTQVGHTSRPSPFDLGLLVIPEELAEPEDETTGHHTKGEAELIPANRAL